MEGRSRPRLGYANVMSTLALFVALGGGAYAISGTTSSTKPVKACFKKKTGALRILRKGKRCRRTERTLTWNRQGRPGVAGTTGPGGPRGPKGATGSLDTSSFYTKAQSDGRFERTTETVYGRARSTNPNVEFFSWPELGLSVQTDPDAGTADDEIQLKNTNPPGTPLIVVLPSGIIGIDGGDSYVATTATDYSASTSQLEVIVRENPGSDPSPEDAPRQIIVHCYFGSESIDHCVGTRSQP
jgi:hypothetical protein